MRNMLNEARELLWLTAIVVGLSAASVMVAVSVALALAH
jgi:hypothetical protein